MKVIIRKKQITPLEAIKISVDKLRSVPAKWL